MRAARGSTRRRATVRAQNANARAGASRDAPQCRRGKIARKTVHDSLLASELAFRFPDDRESSPSHHASGVKGEG